MLAVQNDAPARNIGVATSTATFFRSMGGSLGVAIFGAIFASRLANELATVPGAEKLSGGANIRPDQVHALPPVVRHEFLLAFVDALQPVFLVGAGFTAVAFVLSLMLREVPLRKTTATAEAAEAPRPPRRRWLRPLRRRYGWSVPTPEGYIAGLEEPRRSEIQRLHDLIRETLPELEPNADDGMLGYGRFHYRYDSGREGDASLVALSSRKNYISLYVLCTNEGGYLAEQYVERLPKANIGKSSSASSAPTTSISACCASCWSTPGGSASRPPPLPERSSTG